MIDEKERYDKECDFSFVEEPLRGAVSDYINDCRMRLAPWTAYNYAKDMKMFFEWAAKQDGTQLKELADLTKDLMTAYQEYQYSRHTKQGGNLKPATQGRRVEAVKRFCEYLVAQERILVDPCAGIRTARQPKRLPRNVLTEREMRRLLSAADLSSHVGVRNRAMLEFLYGTGVRNSELRNLKVEDVDLKEGWLRIAAGKGGKERIVPLGKAAVYFVSGYLRQTRPVFLKKKESEYLFLSRVGGKLHQGTLCDIIEALARRAKLKKRITPHGLRHSCATAMLRGRAGIRYIQEMLGHASLQSTQIYTKVEIADLKRVHARCHPREKEAIDRG
jgi:integrase/recombinase XerD